VRFPGERRALPAVTRPRFDTGVSSRAIDRSVRDLVEQALSVYLVDHRAARRARTRPAR
jgi:hypothetical protein